MGTFYIIIIMKYTYDVVAIHSGRVCVRAYNCASATAFSSIVICAIVCRSKSNYVNNRNKQKRSPK